MYLDKTVQNYLDDLASSQSTPGGGSAAALSGALAAGLASMVARLTVGKAKYASVQPEIESILEETEKLRTRFQRLMQEDVEAYGRLSACFKMPQQSDEERAARTKAIQEKLVEAALVPLEIVERATELMKCCEQIAEIGNVAVLSDIATGAALASSAGTGAAWMVRTNLRALKDAARATTLQGRLDAALSVLATGSLRVMNNVGGRV